MDIEEIAKRFADLINQFEPKKPLTKEEVTISHLANICWVLGVTPDIKIVPMENGE